MKRIYRSDKDRKLAGICGGLGELLDVDPTILRLVLVFLVLATGIVPMVVTYVIAWAIIPTQKEVTDIHQDT